MGTHKPNMAKSIRRIRSILTKDWDPIGLHAEDEYTGYVAPLYEILKKEHSEKAVLNYLKWMLDRMGLSETEERLRPIAEKLLQIDLSKDEPFT